MNAWSYVQEKIQKRKEERAYAKRLRRSRLHFPVFCKVHAVTSPDHQGAIAQSRAGDELLIVHTPMPDFPDRVTVYSISLNRALGFLEDSLAEKLVFLFGQDFCRDGEVENITGGAPHAYLGCNVRLLESNDHLQNLGDISLLRE